MREIKDKVEEVLEKASNICILKGLKIDQIAIATKDSKKLVKTLEMLGLDEWTFDEVVAEGTVRGVEGSNKAYLNFNYQMDIEFEVLEYVEGASWHDKLRESKEKSSNFLSHIGYHIHDEKEVIAGSGEIVVATAEDRLQEIKTKFLQAGYKVAQEVWTVSHTNAYLLQQKRKYHYIIFDTVEELGFDVKLIVRRENV